MSADVISFIDRKREKLLGHAISDDGQDYGPELCPRCLGAERIWCDECEYHFCSACHVHGGPRPAA